MKKNLLEQVPCCCASDPGKAAKKLILPDGFQVGIINFDQILREVADLKLTDSSAIKAELLKRTAVHNYIPSSAESEYAAALYKEYRKTLEADGNG